MTSHTPFIQPSALPLMSLMPFRRWVGTAVITGLLLAGSSSPALATPSNKELDQRLKKIEQVVIPNMQQELDEHSAKLSELRTELTELSERAGIDLAKVKAQIADVENKLQAEITELSGTVEGRSPMRFTVITSSAQKLDDRKDRVSLMFNLPDVDTSKGAILMHNTFGIHFKHNKMEINGVPVANALSPTAFDFDQFLDDFEVTLEKSNLALVGGRQHKLRARDNVLEITARDQNGNAGRNIDDFSIDNIVILYHAR